MSFRVSRTVAIIAAAMLSACAATHTSISQQAPVDDLDNDHGLALRGYDSAGYFSEARPIEGDPAISYRWHGATWHFASMEHRDAFAADPARYAPQFGGYCAYAVSRGTTADGDPQQWAVVDGKLYVNNNALALTLWNQDRAGNIQAGVTNWPLIPKRPLPRP
jgi:YHS domain-containing protein